MLMLVAWASSLLHIYLTKHSPCCTCPACADFVGGSACRSLPLLDVVAQRQQPQIPWHRAFKTVVFVIDQVDAFVRACKQTLLYNVLDALTSSQVQVRCGVRYNAHTHTCAT